MSTQEQLDKIAKEIYDECCKERSNNKDNPREVGCEYEKLFDNVKRFYRTIAWWHMRQGRLMTDQQQIEETKGILDGVLDRWCPEFSRRTEPHESQMMRALLLLNAYELDAKRCFAGEQPIHTGYPLPLPPIAPKESNE